MLLLTPSEAYKIVFPILLTIQLCVVTFCGILLIRRRNFYPIKQLSPFLTLYISISTLIVSLILAICRFTDIYKSNNWVFALMSVLYVFFREFLILAFYMRCLRICAAYFKTQKPWIIFIFSRETAIALLTAAISIIPSIVQLIQFLIYQNVNVMVNFFPFYVVEETPDVIDFFPIWLVDNSLFFLVLVLSQKVHERFKFTKTLVVACLLFHAESWYYFVGILSVEASQSIRDNFEYIVMCIHTVFLWLILTPSLRPNQYEHPLPQENTLNNPNTALLDRQTYLIISEYVDQLEVRSLAFEERRRKASTWLLIYTTFKITQRRIAEIQLQPEKSTTSEEDDNEVIRELLHEYVEEIIIPNLDVNLVESAVGEVFLEDEDSAESRIREDLVLEHFRKLNRRLDDAINHIFKEWKKTKSYQLLREEFRGNSKIITAMTKLRIGI